ncbi:MAG: RHS repeat-associated core domain-containing protein [Flavobacteriales bacterium]|nr:RHS repeat-associated core domain-containing protein [Flavobacteriales bacterium]
MNQNGTAEILMRADYYPFGMEMPGRKYASESYRYGYQGQYAEKDGETSLHHFELRQWDARIARWNSTDPYGQHFSPYMGMGNNPVSLVDPNGGWVPGAGFWNNLFYSDNRINAMNAAGSDGSYFRDPSGGWTANFSDSEGFNIMNFDKASDFGSSLNRFAEVTLSSVITTSTVVIMPVINQTNVIMNEGVHSGSAYDINNVVDWAVPYKIKDWKLHPLENNNAGKKEVFNATFNTILMVTPLKINTGIKVVDPVLEEAVKITISDVAGKAIDKIK